MSPFLIIIFLWVYDMTTRRAATRRVEEEIENAGVSSQDNQAPPQEQVSLGD